MSSLTESTVEEAALEWFGELGYAIGHAHHRRRRLGQAEWQEVSARWQRDRRAAQTEVPIHPWRFLRAIHVGPKKTRQGRKGSTFFQDTGSLADSEN